MPGRLAEVLAAGERARAAAPTGGAATELWQIVKKGAEAEIPKLRTMMRVDPLHCHAMAGMLLGADLGGTTMTQIAYQVAHEYYNLGWKDFAVWKGDRSLPHGGSYIHPADEPNAWPLLMSHLVHHAKDAFVRVGVQDPAFFLRPVAAVALNEVNNLTALLGAVVDAWWKNAGHWSGDQKSATYKLMPTNAGFKVGAAFERVVEKLMLQRGTRMPPLNLAPPQPVQMGMFNRADTDSWRPLFADPRVWNYILNPGNRALVGALQAYVLNGQQLPAGAEDDPDMLACISHMFRQLWEAGDFFTNAHVYQTLTNQAQAEIAADRLEAEREGDVWALANGLSTPLGPYEDASSYIKAVKWKEQGLIKNDDPNRDWFYDQKSTDEDDLDFSKWRL